METPLPSSAVSPRRSGWFGFALPVFLAGILSLTALPETARAQIPGPSEPSLTVIFRSLSFSQTSSNGMGEIWRSHSDLMNPLPVTLRADPRVELPAEVVIPAGKSYGSFPIRIRTPWFDFVDAEEVWIQAEAAGHELGFSSFPFQLNPADWGSLELPLAIPKTKPSSKEWCA